MSTRAERRRFVKDMTKAQLEARDPLAGQLIDLMLPQLLILLVNRLGGSVDVPVAEIDHGTKGFTLGMSVDQARRVFTFQTQKKN